MSFLTSADYDDSIYAEILTSITRNSSTTREKAELRSIDQVKSYLTARFDVENVFNKTGENRSPVIVGIVKDIAIYHMHAIINPLKIPDIRVKRYDDAIDFLKQIVSGDLNPDLPKIGTDAKDAIRYGGNKKRSTNF